MHGWELSRPTLDEMCEFPAAVLDALRQPIEEGVACLCRALRTTASGLATAR